MIERFRTSSEQYPSYIHYENKFGNNKSCSLKGKTCGVYFECKLILLQNHIVRDIMASDKYLYITYSARSIVSKIKIQKCRKDKKIRATSF